MTWSDENEADRLLNPAFLSLVVGRAASGYEANSPRGLPLALAYLTPPIALHARTRERFPRTTATSMTKWVSENRVLVGELGPRAERLVPATKEAIVFGLTCGSLSLNDVDLSSTFPNATKSRLGVIPSENFVACLRAAEFFGKWCAKAGDVRTIYSTWGVKA